MAAPLNERIGDPTDSEATGNGSAIAILKRIRTLLGSALGFDATDKLKVSVYGTGAAAGDTTLKLRSWTADGQATAGDAILSKALLHGPTGLVAASGSDGDLANAAHGARFSQFLIVAHDGTNNPRIRTPSTFKTLAAVAVTAASPVAGWTPAAGKKFRLMGFALSLSVAGAVILKDSATELIRTPLMAAGVGLVAPPMGNGMLSATANNVLNIDVTATGTVSGFLYGTEE